MQAYLNSAQACEHIIKEYLAQGCPYEINISAGMRDRTIQRSVLYIEACKQAVRGHTPLNGKASMLPELLPQVACAYGVMMASRAWIG